MRRMLVWVALVWALTGFAGGTAQGEEKPQLMLDTAGHMSIIRAIVFTPDGKLVSASDDKTIRVWDVAAGKTVRTIRGEVAPGDAGKIFAMALSPDGKLLAVGGYAGIYTGGKPAEDEETNKIRLYDFASGKLVALLKGHGDVVERLAFSPDGRYLISGSADATAIIWDVAARKAKHRLKGHTAEIYGVGFTPDGARAVTGSYDHDLRLWSVDNGALLQIMRGHGDKVHTLAVAPDGSIASGDDLGEIRLWDGQTGAFLKTLAQQKTLVGSLSFSPDGKLLLSGVGRAWYECHVYDVVSGREIVTYKGHDNTVVATAISPDGRWAATGGGYNMEIHLWDVRTGERRQGADGRPMTLRGTGRSVNSVGISADGHQIAWGNSDPCPDQVECPNHPGPLEHTLMLPSANAALSGPQQIGVTSPPPAGTSLPQARTVNATVLDEGAFVRAVPRNGAWSLRHRDGGNYGYDAILDIVEGETVRASIERGSVDGYAHHGYSFTADGKTIISGGMNGVLTAYDLAGKKLGNFIGHESDVFAVAVSPDGRYVVSGSADQTLRLWNLKTRELLVTLFRGTDGEWVMWTPEGFFAASEKGASLVGWHINQGPDKEARYISASQLRRLLLRPDLVAAKILGDPDGLVKRAAARLNIEELLKRALAPKVTILSPADGTRLDEASVDVTVRVTDRGGGIRRLFFKLNGRQEADPLVSPALLKDGQYTHSFKLGEPNTEIEVMASDKSGQVFSLPAKITVKVDPKIIEGVPNLYVLALGVNRYKDERMNLSFAVTDAESLAKALKAAGTGFYRDPPEIKMLLNEEVTAEKVKAAFMEMGAKVKATDVFVFYTAGHGMTIDGDYYFVPGSAEDFKKEKIKVQGFGPAVFSSWFTSIHAAKAIFIFDTCEAGSAVNIPGLRSRGVGAEEAAYQRLKDATGRTIFMATSEREQAKEGYRNHGLFTYAFLEGLAQAGNPSDRYVDLTDLKKHVENRVPEIIRQLKACDNCQKPIVPILGSNYILVRRYPEIMEQLAKGEMVAVSRRPTHAVIAAVDVFDTTSRGSSPTRRLKKGEQVTVLKVEDGLAYIAQNGTPIGYVDYTKLLELIP